MGISQTDTHNPLYIGTLSMKNIIGVEFDMREVANMIFDSFEKNCLKVVDLLIMVLLYTHSP